MFKKLLSNLPFNPSLIGQVSFYAQRIKRESTVRRTGLVFIVLAMGVQFLATVSPAQATLNCSTNDVINCGFSRRDQAVLHCLNTSENFSKILLYYGVTCTDLGNAPDAYITSNALNYNSLGRNQQGAYISRTGKPTHEYPVDISGAGRLWMKDLKAWDGSSPNTYKVLKITKNGNVIMVMYDCGNIVTIGRFTPPAPKPTPPPPPPAPPVVLPKAISCSNLVMNVADGAKIKLGTKVSVRGQAAGKNIPSGQKVDMYYEFVNASTKKVITSNKSAGVAYKSGVANDSKTYDYSSETSGQYLIRLTVKYDSNKTADKSATGDCIKHITVAKPCEDVTTADDLELCLDLHKKAKNSTQGIADANGSTAHAGDTIEYTISVTNSGTVTVPKFLIKENLNDVLEYANITDMHGGQIDKDNFIYWPVVDVKPKQTIQKFITIKVKNPIPSTPVSTSDPESFNLIMTNVYGDTVNIKLPPSVVKRIETATTLPNTGPGESLAIGFGLTVVVGYFFARSRLFSTELDIVRHDFNNGGA